MQFRHNLLHASQSHIRLQYTASLAVLSEIHSNVSYCTVASNSSVNHTIKQLLFTEVLPSDQLEKTNYVFNAIHFCNCIIFEGLGGAMWLGFHFTTIFYPQKLHIYLAKHHSIMT